MEASGVSEILYKQLAFRAERQKVLAGNVANINTPGYKVKDVEFEDVLKSEQSLSLTKTNHKHLSLDDNKGANSINSKIIEKEASSADGNSVDLDKQMGEIWKNQMMYNSITASIKKDAAWFKSVIASSKDLN